MNLKEQYPVSKVIVEEGVRCQIGDAIFILSYYNSSKSQLFFHSELQKLKNTADPEEAVLSAMRSTLVRCVVLGWENLFEDDQEVVYSREECERLLNTYEGLDMTLMEKSLEVIHFREEAAKEILGN